jgi:hypothetical protein
VAEKKKETFSTPSFLMFYLSSKPVLRINCEHMEVPSELLMKVTIGRNADSEEGKEVHRTK